MKYSSIPNVMLLYARYSAIPNIMCMRYSAIPNIICMRYSNIPILPGDRRNTETVCCCTLIRLLQNVCIYCYTGM